MKTLICGGVIMTIKRSGFDGPCIGGKPYPKGSKIKKNADGTVDVIEPKKKADDKKKKKTK